MNRQYSQKIFNNPSILNYQNQKMVFSPRHQQMPSPEYHKNNFTNPSPNIPTPKKGMLSPGGNAPFINKIEARKESNSKSPKRKIVVSPSPKPDLKMSREGKMVEVEIRRKDEKTSQVSLFENKPSAGPIIQTPGFHHKNKVQQLAHFPNSNSPQSAKPSSTSNKIYCSQQEVVNLLHGKISKQLDRMSINKQMIDSSIKQLKEGVQFYYDKLQQRIRSYRRLDYEKIKDYQKNCIRHIHDYQNIFNKAMGDIISIKTDYNKDKSITHDFVIATLENTLKSYENQKVKKLHYVYKDLTSLVPYESVSTLSYTDPSPPMISQPLIKFDTQLNVKQVVSNNLIVNNPEFSFFDPQTSLLNG